MTFPEPPWTQAPSEVLAWGASTGRRRGEPFRPHRPARVKGFETRLSTAAKSKFFAHLARLGLVPSGERPESLSDALARLAHRPADTYYGGRVGGTRVQVRVRTRDRVEVRVAFTPHVSFRRAWRIVSRMELPTAEGAWL